MVLQLLQVLQLILDWTSHDAESEKRQNREEISRQAEESVDNDGGSQHDPTEYWLVFSCPKNIINIESIPVTTALDTYLA